MVNVLVIVEGSDPTALMLARATARLGHTTSIADLVRDRFELRTGMGGGVRLNGEPLAVDAVVNRTGINGLGLASADALRRQSGATWYELHSAAREDQGLLLAVLDWFSLAGVRVVNAPEAAELELMRNVVIERLARRGVAMSQSEAADVSYLVTGGRVALQPGQDRPDAGVLVVCKLVSELAAFDIGEVRFTSGDDGHRLVGWTSRPDLTHLDVEAARAIAESLMRELVGSGELEAVQPVRPFITDMVDRFEQG